MKLIDTKPQVGKFCPIHPTTLDEFMIGDEVLTWDVVGQDSDEYLNSQQDFLKHIEELGDEADKMTAVDYKLQTALQLSKLVKGWDEQFNESMGGPYSPELVEELLTSQDYKWIVNQLDVFVARRNNFFLE